MWLLVWLTFFLGLNALSWLNCYLGKLVNCYIKLWLGTEVNVLHFLFKSEYFHERVFPISFIEVLFWLLSKVRGPVRSWPRGRVTTTRLCLTLRSRPTSPWFDTAPDEVAYAVTGMVDFLSEFYPERVFSISDGHRPSNK